jgi:hypothetical protein
LRPSIRGLRYSSFKVADMCIEASRKKMKLSVFGIRVTTDTGIRNERTSMSNIKKKVRDRKLNPKIQQIEQ